MPGANRVVCAGDGGYGIDECLVGGEPCGMLGSAQSWCQSNGYKDSIPPRGARRRFYRRVWRTGGGEAGGAVVINCGSQAALSLAYTPPQASASADEPRWVL